MKTETTPEALRVGIFSAGLVGPDQNIPYAVVDPRNFNRDEIYKASVKFGFWIVHRYNTNNDARNDPGTIQNDGIAGTETLSGT